MATTGTDMQRFASESARFVNNTGNATKMLTTTIDVSSELAQTSSTALSKIKGAADTTKAIVAGGKLATIGRFVFGATPFGVALNLAITAYQINDYMKVKTDGFENQVKSIVKNQKLIELVGHTLPRLGLV